MLYRLLPVTTKELTDKQYEKELLRLQTELVYLQEWIVAGGRRLVVLFEGRDTAGKDGAIKRIITYLNPRTCRVVALPTPLTMLNVTAPVAATACMTRRVPAIMAGLGVVALNVMGWVVTAA